MSDYSIKTKASWSQTLQELEREFALWGIANTEWETNYPRGARLSGMNQEPEDRTVRLTYKLRGKDISFIMGDQSRAVDNLRVLFLAIHSLRLNEVRGIGALVESAYMQLAAPKGKRDPYEVLSIYPGSPVAVAEAAFKEKAKKAHPDSGGSLEEMKELNEAIQEIREKK